MTHRFSKYASKFGGVVWVGEVVKVVSRGEVVKSMILILPITKIFDKIYTCNLLCGLELACYYLFC